MKPTINPLSIGLQTVAVITNLYNAYSATCPVQRERSLRYAALAAGAIGAEVALGYGRTWAASTDVEPAFSVTIAPEAPALALK